MSTAYGSAENFKKYITDRGKAINESWQKDVIESALLVASEWLDNQYENCWIGYKANGYTQERSWPRKSAVAQTYPTYTFPDTEIPSQVVWATYEAAYRYLQDNKVLQSDYTPSKYSMVSITGSLTVQFNETLTGASDVQTQFPIIQNLMSDLIDPNKEGSLSPLTGKAIRL